MKALWKCMVEGCNFTAPPTARGYKQMTGHMLGHASKGLGKEERKYALVDEDTGEVLASKMTEAKEKGLLVDEERKESPASPEPAPREEGKPKEEKKKEEGKPKEEEKKEEGKPKEEEKKGGEEITIPQPSAEGIFRYTITLPADAFTLFNLAKFSGLEKDGEKPFDEWVWDCITARFRTDYKRQLILAPLEEV